MNQEIISKLKSNLILVRDIVLIVRAHFNFVIIPMTSGQVDEEH